MSFFRGLVAWGTLMVLVLAVLWSFTVIEWEEISEASEHFEQRQTLLQRLENLPKREGKIREVLVSLNDGLAQRSLYGGDALSIRTEVQRDVRAIASKAKIRVATMRPLGARRTGGEIDLSTVQLNYVATYAENLEFMTYLEAAEPILRIQRLSIAVQTASTETSPAMLSVTMEVAGFVEDAGDAR